MVDFSTLLQAIPQFGNSVISNLYERYHGWASRTEIPAYQSSEGPMVFTDGKIFLNKQDLSEALEQPHSHSDMPFWLGISESVKSYRAWYYKEIRKRKDLDDITDEELVALDGDTAEFEKVANHILNKVYRKLKRRYDETTDGLAFHLDEEGVLTINGMKIESFLEMARRYPTDKARMFLKGLRNRLSVILANRNGNPNYDKIRDSSVVLFAEIDHLLNRRNQVILLPAAKP